MLKLLKNLLSRLPCRDRPDVPTWHGRWCLVPRPPKSAGGVGGIDFLMIDNDAGQKEKKAPR